MFTFFKKQRLLAQQVQDLTARLNESRQVVLEQRREIITLKNRIASIQTQQAVIRKAKPVKAPAVAPKPLLLQDENSGSQGRKYNEWHASRPDARKNAREAAEAIRVDHSSPKRAEDSGNDFLTGALTGLLVAEIFDNDSSRSSSSSDSSSSSSCSSSTDYSSGGGGDFGGGGASGTFD